VGIAILRWVDEADYKTGAKLLNTSCVVVWILKQESARRADSGWLRRRALEQLPGSHGRLRDDAFALLNFLLSVPPTPLFFISIF
jgi:predicted LPLAT superfamily acyltransferase